MLQNFVRNVAESFSSFLEAILNLGENIARRNDHRSENQRIKDDASSHLGTGSSGVTEKELGFSQEAENQPAYVVGHLVGTRQADKHANGNSFQDFVEGDEIKWTLPDDSATQGSPLSKPVTDFIESLDVDDFAGLGADQQIEAESVDGHRARLIEQAVLVSAEGQTRH